MRSTVRELHEELKLRQRRLGTPAEAADDFERILSLAHEINNHIAAEYLRAVTERDESPTLISLRERVLAR